MGSITLQTELHTSRFGDERLFYQHIVREDDGPYMPFGWQFADNKIDPHRQLKYGGRWNIPLPPLDAPRGWPSDDAAAKAMYQEQEATRGCPLAWLFDLANVVSNPYTGMTVETLEDYDENDPHALDNCCCGDVDGCVDGCLGCDQ